MKKTPKRKPRTLSVRLVATDYDTLKRRRPDARRSLSDFTRLMLALALHATRDDPSIVLPTKTGSR